MPQKVELGCKARLRRLAKNPAYDQKLAKLRTEVEVRAKEQKLKEAQKKLLYFKAEARALAGTVIVDWQGFTDGTKDDDDNFLPLEFSEDVCEGVLLQVEELVGCIKVEAGKIGNYYCDVVEQKKSGSKATMESSPASKKTGRHGGRKPKGT